MNFKSIAAALALGLSAWAGQAATVQLTPAGDLHVGQTFELQLHLNKPFESLAADELLLSFGFKLDYDNSLLSFKGFKPQSGWDDDSGWLGAGQFGASAFPGVANSGQTDLFLATMSFEVLGAGATQLRLFSETGNLNLGLSYLDAGGRELSATQSLQLLSPIPEPTSALLLLAGLAGLGLAHRRRSLA